MESGRGIPKYGLFLDFVMAPGGSQHSTQTKADGTPLRP